MRMSKVFSESPFQIIKNIYFKIFIIHDFCNEIHICIEGFKRVAKLKRSDVNPCVQDTLKQIFCNQSITKIGFQIENDIQKIQQLLKPKDRFNTNQILDLANYQKEATKAGKQTKDKVGRDIDNKNGISPEEMLKASSKAFSSLFSL